MIYCKRPSAFVETRIDDELVLINTATGRFDALRDTGLLVWQEMDGRRTLAQICENLVATHAVDESTCARDVGLFVEQLLDAGYIAEF